jgi:hypothetical protein
VCTKKIHSRYSYRTRFRCSIRAILHDSGVSAEAERRQILYPPKQMPRIRLPLFAIFFFPIFAKLGALTFILLRLPPCPRISVYLSVFRTLPKFPTESEFATQSATLCRPATLSFARRQVIYYWWQRAVQCGHPSSSTIQ